MYGFSDQSNGMPLTRLRADRQGSSRYSTPTPGKYRTYVRSRGARSRGPARDASAADRPGHVHCYLLPATTAGRSSTPGSALPDVEERVLRARRPDRRAIVITHFHPDHVGGADGRPRPRRARRSSRASSTTSSASASGGVRTGRERIAAWFCGHGVPRSRRRADRVGSRLRAVRPLRARPGARCDEGDERRRLAGRRRCPGHADGHLALAARRRARRRRPPARPRSRRRSASIPRAGPTRSATTSTRCDATIELAPRVVYRGHGEPIDDAGRPRARADRAPPERLDATRGGARRRAAHGLRVSLRPLRRASSRRRSGASPSPRRSPTSSGSSREGRARAADEDAPATVCLYCAPVDDDFRLSTRAPGPGRERLLCESSPSRPDRAGNALFVAAEYALVTARRTRLELQHAAAAGARATALRLMDEPAALHRARCSSASRLQHPAIGALGEPLLSRLLRPVHAARARVRRSRSSILTYFTS